MTGNKSLDNIFLICGFTASFITLGVVFYTRLVFEKPLPKESILKKEFIEENKTYNPATSFEINKLIINLKSRSTRLRFLEIKPFLISYKESFNSYHKRNQAYIQDVFIDTAGRMSPEELSNISGKILFSSRVRNRINSYYDKNIIKDIQYTQFVIQ